MQSEIGLPSGPHVECFTETRANNVNVAECNYDRLCVHSLQSLSAAHMLMADEFKSRGGPADDVPMPQALRSQWERAKTLKKCQDDGASVEQTSEMERAVLSPDTVMETVTVSWWASNSAILLKFL